MANPHPVASWQRGQTGNPNGRPLKEHSITQIFRQMFIEQPQLREMLARKILDLALAGDMSAIKTLWAYMDGKPPTRVVMTEPINISEKLDELEEKNKEARNIYN